MKPDEKDNEMTSFNMMNVNKQISMTVTRHIKLFLSKRQIAA